MGKLNFTFNNIQKDYIQMLVGRKRPSWAPVKRNLVKVPHRPGAFFMNTETQERRIEVPIAIKAKKDMADLQKIKEDLAEWLFTEQPTELIFDDELDRTYLALMDGSVDLEELVNRGKGIITFVCPMPYKLGPTKTVEFEMDGRGLIANVQNKGTVHSEPIIEIEVANPSTFLDVWNKDEYLRIGYPLQADQLPVERKQRVMWDQMSTTVGWTSVSQFENTKGGGTLKSNGHQFYVEDYGDTNYKGNHGAIVKKSIPGGPLQDFIMDAYVRFNCSSYVQMGQVEVALLDENSKPVVRLSLSDVFWEAEETFGVAKIAYPGHQAEQVMLYTRGMHPWTWNNFYGKLCVHRIGNEWEFYIAKFADGTEIDDAGTKVSWVDKEGILMNEVAQVQLSICQWWSNNPPYIVEKGDKVQIDTAKSLISINGTSAINLKDFFSDYPKITKGQNKLEIMPSNIGIAKVTYKERFR
ncbi:distal tail protein Dit [Bacillus cereus group sp. TH152-1LC]|uniref:distal tail protein Dit n=1 Tax=Bacillus cereus group sp. TH152-1LC TaxID=3018060 RepID=UPI0022E4A298|nr:distal tail protein Dit [Bacillus cereus group sp. TH152-1LC]MDA1676787.1 phage tail family protein [Bacillus cereus group sp. TH152-1LC]